MPYSFKGGGDQMANPDNTPQAGLGGSSYLYDMGTSPNTRTAVSQKIRILTPHYGNSQALQQMGVLSQFNPSQSRSVEPVRGVGFGDKVAELVPSVTEPTTGNFERALLYLSNLWQATGYASGVDGPVRSLAHHKWPFDIEQQVVFSTLADMDLGVGNQGMGNESGTFEGGVKKVTFPQVTNPEQRTVSNPGHSALITIYEACWFTSWSTTFAKDSGMIMESGDVTVTDVHDFASVYGEFMATGNDPSLGQLGSIRFAESGAQNIGTAGQGIGAGQLQPWQRVQG
jgi:hypothetical protein